MPIHQINMCHFFMNERTERGLLFHRLFNQKMGYIGCKWRKMFVKAFVGWMIECHLRALMQQSAECC